MNESITGRALDTVFRTLMIDDEWSVRRPDGFTWVAHRYRQDVDVRGPWESRGYQVIRLSSEIPLVEEIRADEGRVLSVLGAMNCFAVGEALVWDAEERRVLCCSGVVTHGETLEWRVQQLSAFAITGLVFAEIRGGFLADQLSGRPPSWVHPSSGPRTEPDDMLNVLEEGFAPEGRTPSRFARDGEFEAIADLLRGGPFFTSGGSPEGISVEVAFGESDTSLIQASTTQPHPTLGNGLLVTTRIRLPEGADDTPARAAARLNARERKGDFEGASFGAWCTQDMEGNPVLAHACFVPNALCRPGVSQDVILNAAHRAHWAAGSLLPEGAEPPRSAADIV